MNVVDNEWIANNESGTTQKDNANHLYGAVRLIRRQITDDNAAIYLLASFCLILLGTNDNKVLQEELENMYIEGMKVFYRDYIGIGKDFWKDIFEKFNQNQRVKTYLNQSNKLLKSVTILEIHKYELKSITNKYAE